MTTMTTNESGSGFIVDVLGCQLGAHPHERIAEQVQPLPLLRVARSLHAGQSVATTPTRSPHTTNVALPVASNCTARSGCARNFAEHARYMMFSRSLSHNCTHVSVWQTPPT